MILESLYDADNAVVRFYEDGDGRWVRVAVEYNDVVVVAKRQVDHRPVEEVVNEAIRAAMEESTVQVRRSTLRAVSG